MKRGGFLSNRKDRKAFDMPFAWIFAIIAGAVILFLAIYATTGLINVAKYREYTEAAKSITILIDPLETGIADAAGQKIIFGKETRIYYDCYAPSASEAFGRQTLAFSEEAGLGKKWSEPGGEISIRNKFIFADVVEQGEVLYTFAKPFYAGFKVGDVIITTAKKYCFAAPPNAVENDISQLTVLGSIINLTNTIEECGEGSLKVCFNSQENACDISVYDNKNDFETGYVTKEGKSMGYAGSLLYAAIFSNYDIYECNVLRLAKKTAELAKVYLDKIKIVEVKNCNSVIEPDLNNIAGTAEGLKSSADIINVYGLAQQMDNVNRDASCEIYSGEDY